MSVKPKKVGNKWIVVEAKTGRKSKHSGTFKTKGEAERQARAINANLHKKK